MAIYTSSDIIAQRYVVSSSVSHYTSSAASGSHIFGDSPDDTHQFTGSLFISGSRIDLDDGNENIALGTQGIALTTGIRNILIGHDSGDALTTGARNVAIGVNTLGAATTANFNVAVGQGAM